MSEIAVASSKPQKSRLKLFLVVASTLLLLLVYGAGIIALPITILYNYRAKDCDSVLRLNTIYANGYPRFIQDTTLSTPVSECEAFVRAAASEENGSWRDAYDAYQTYSTTYPGGLFAAEAHEHSALALMSLAKEQIDQKQYEEALANLKLIVSSYSNTSASADVWSLLPSTYASWGAGFRESKNFERSEQVFNDFKSWSENNQKTDFVTDAQRELVQTYLAWAREFQSQKQYENALAKYDLAAAADPQSQFDSAPQARAGQSTVYVAWGNDLLEQKQFPVAIEKFKLAVSKSAGTNDAVAGDALANGYIQSAHELSTGEDFKAALEQFKPAMEAAVSDEMKKSVETALQETYLAFSNSNGPQARQAMKEALKAVCQKHKAPDLPIFGLNKDLVRFGIYGVDDKLPENLAAKTPGEMHYIACIETANKTVETRYKLRIIFRTSRGYYYVRVQEFRVQILWNANLIQTDTGESVAETALTGDMPPPFPEGEDDSGGYFYGPSPMEELAQWLQSVID